MAETASSGDTETDTNRLETRVDADIIHKLAPAFNMGAGGLKGMLLGDPDPEDTRHPKAVKRAYEIQDKRDQEAQ